MQESQVVYGIECSGCVIATVMATSRVCCRVCLESVEQKYSIALFGDVGMRMKWANRLEELLRVPVSLHAEQAAGESMLTRGNRDKP